MATCNNAQEILSFQLTNGNMHEVHSPINSLHFVTISSFTWNILLFSLNLGSSLLSRLFIYLILTTTTLCLEVYFELSSLKQINTSHFSEFE